jgi:Phage derived protein Gp49-like (DUF891)
MLLFETIISGKVKNIVAIKDGVRCASMEYIRSLEKKIRIKIFAVMKIMADFGVIRNKEKFNHLEDKIYEFKAQRARVFCFHYQNDIVCTHGADKPHPRRLKIEIDKAKRIREQFLQEREDKNGN